METGVKMMEIDSVTVAEPSQMTHDMEMEDSTNPGDLLEAIEFQDPLHNDQSAGLLENVNPEKFLEDLSGYI